MIQKKGLKRDTIDKYYTKTEVTIECITEIIKNINILEDDLIIEPSAGDGAFINGIKKLSKNYLFYDIEPDAKIKEIIKEDFLNVEYIKLKEKYKNIHIIGNPPFGRQSSLAIKFIKRCCLFAMSISFILPKSFKKESMKAYFSNNYHLKYEIDLKENAFLVNGKEYNVPCIFQIWIFKEEKREKIKKDKPLNFKFIKKEEEPDISFRRVGSNAGFVSTYTEDKNIQSHYFIKFTNNKLLNENIEKIKETNYETNNTVGPKSISKQELIKEFNKKLIF